MSDKAGIFILEIAALFHISWAPDFGVCLRYDQSRS